MRFKTEIKYDLLAVLGVMGWTFLAWQMGWHTDNFEPAKHGKQVAGVIFAGCIWLAVRDRLERATRGVDDDRD